MPNAAILGAALTDHSAHPYSLEVGGLDVIKEPGNTGMGVSLDSIIVNEVGPGGVSSMEFVIDDPNGAISISQPLTVFFKANDGASPETVYFRGWIDSTDNSPAFGGQGRQITVRCSGIEQMLDWAIVPPSWQIPFASILPRFVGMLASQFAPQLLRTGTDSGANMLLAPWTRTGSFSNPIGNFLRPSEPSLASFGIVGYTSPGGTLRNAILDIANKSLWQNSGTAALDFNGVKILLTVDFWYGLRIWEDDPTLQPDDYTTLVVNDTYASSNVADSLNFSTDFANISRAAYVIGSGGTDYGVTSDGTGVNGRTVLVNDSAVTSDVLARGRAMGTLGEDSASTRGTFVLGPWAPTTTVHAGSLLTLTDQATGVSNSQRIMEIEKRFRGDGQQTWTVTFGGLAGPRLSRFTRRLTRAYN